MAKKNLYINQIFKGIAPSQYFGVEGTYNSASAIDPDLPIVSTDVRTSGFPVPVGSEALTTTNVTGAVIREITHPKDNMLWTVQSNGKIVTFKSDLTTERLIGTVAGSNATWAEYYNNYIYVFGTGASKNDVSRIGPLNTLPYDAQSANFTVGLTVTGGTTGATGIITADVDGGTTGTLTLSNIVGQFQDNETITDTSTGSATVNRTDASLITDAWWTSTLSLTALTNTKYPTFRGVDMPNHVATVHSDGSMYFLDFANGQGLVHRINTKKGTNEGDTNGTTVPSAYNALDLPFGFYPTSLAPYSTDMLITGNYQTDVTTNQGASAFVIWDPTDTDTFKTGPIPLADPIASACKNVNGSVYIWTGNAVNGVRMSLYNGGVSVRELVYQEEGLPPFAGAVDASGNRIVWGGHSTYPLAGAAVYGYGSKNASLPSGVQNIMSTVASSTGVCDSYSESNVSTYSSINMSGTGNTGFGQSFTGDGKSIISSEFYMYKHNTATGTVVAKVYAHSGSFGTSSVPTGTALATSSPVDVSTLGLSSTPRLVSFTFDSPYQTTNATKYVVVVEVESTGSLYCHLGTDTSSPTHGGNLVTYNSGFTASSTKDLAFYVNTTGALPNVTALKYVQQSSNITPKIVLAWRYESAQGIDQYSTTATLNSKIRWMFNLGSKFDITRVYIPLAGAVASGVTITPTLYFDDLSSNKILSTINNTNYSGKRKVTYKGTELKDCTGYNNFILEIAYTGTVPLPVALPIKIEIDIKDDEV